MYYVEFLADTHRRLSPRAYLEIGVASGKTLALAHCPALGVDPSFSITAELRGDVALFRTSSDEYFSRPDPLSPTAGLPFDLTFIDGLHLFEYALRDFVNAERHSSAGGMVIFDDVFPRNVDEAARERHTTAWTGDVFHVLQVLAEYRPDLFVVPVNTSPTGLLAVFGLDPASTVLADHYGAIIDRFRSPDPQTVPAGVLDRSTLVRPARFLSSGVLETLGPLSSATPSSVREAVRPVVEKQLGVGFGGTDQATASAQAVQSPTS